MLFGQEHVDKYRETDGEDGDDYVVIASKGGADEHPDWFVNLRDNPQVEIQVGADRRAATASIVDDQERRTRLWDQMAQIWPDYDSYAEKTDRRIPVVVLEPAAD